MRAVCAVTVSDVLSAHATRMATQQKTAIRRTGRHVDYAGCRSGKQYGRGETECHRGMSSGGLPTWE